MARATDKADAAIRRYTASFGRVGVEAKVVSAAVAGASDSALKLFANVESGGSAFSRVGSQGSAAFKAIGAAADVALQSTEARILAIADKARQVRDQAAKLTAGAVADNTAGTLSADGLKNRLADIRTVQKAELDRIAIVAQADASADAENLARRKSAESFLANLNRTASTIRADGTLKPRAELLAEEAALRGVGAQAQAAISRIALLDGKTGQLGKTAFSSRNQLLTLQYTISDVIASAGTGISPLTILLQQGPQLAQVEGGIGGIFRTAVGLISPFRAAMGGAVAAIAGVGFAWFKGAEQSKVFNDAIVLSGNFVGQTEGQFNNLTRTIAEGGQVTASAAREFGQALIATGEIGPEVFAKATKAAALYGQATGKNAKDVAQSFASMSQDAGKWATENNRSLNFVTVAQLELIKGMQESGRATEAQALTIDLLLGRLGGLEGNLGNIDKALRLGRSLWDQWWNSALAVGRNETVEDKLAKVEARIAAFRAQQGSAAKPGEGYQPSSLGGIPLSKLNNESDETERRRLLRVKDIQDGAVAATAAAAKLTKQATAGRANVETLLASTKSTEQYSKALQALNRDLEANAKAGTPFTAQQEKAARDELKKRFTDKGDRGAAKDAANERKAQLDKDLQVFAAALAKEKDALKFQQDELKAIYDTGNQSLAKFYDDREATIKSGTAAELAEQNKAVARLKQELGRKDLNKDERASTEKQLAEAQAKATKIVVDADNAATLATYERAAAVKALTREVENFQASLKDLQGDPLGAAQLRAGQQIEAARILAARAAAAGGSSGDFARFDRGQSPVDLDAYAKAINLGNDFAEVQRKVGVATANVSRAEEAYLLRAKQGGVGLVAQDQAVYTLRAAALVQLGELRDKALELARAEDLAAAAAGRLADPKVKAYAADLALQYANAAQAVDPAMARLKAHGDELGASLANVFGDAINNGRSFLDLVNNIGRTVTASITKTLITEPLEQFLKGSISSLVQGSGPVGNLLQGVVGASAGAGPAAAAQATTLSLSQLTLAAGQASLALQSIAGSSASSAVSTGGGGLFGWLGGLFGGGSGGVIPGGVGAVPYHTGGLVGHGGAARSVSSAAFAGAKRYHDGGVIAGAAGLGANEVPAILMGGPRGIREEVLHASDPRHRDNMGASLLRMLAAGGAMRGNAAGYTKPAVRYHSGGVAGLTPDGVAGMVRGASGGRDDSSRQPGRRGGDTFNISVPAGTSRDTAEQIASRVAMKISSASRRNN